MATEYPGSSTDRFWQWDLSPAAQALAVGGAAYTSLAFGVVTQYHYIPEASSPPFAFWVACMLLVAVWVLVAVSGGPMRELIRGAVLPSETHADLAPRLWRWIWQTLFVALSLGVIFTLAWFTVFSGGILDSPYNTTLLFVAVGSLGVARKPWVPGLIFAWTAAVCAFFYIWGAWFTGLAGGTVAVVDPPDGLKWFAVGSNAAIAVVIYYARIWYRRSVKVKLDAVNDAPAAPPVVDQSVDGDARRGSGGSTGHYELYRDTAGDYRFRFRAANGEILLNSASFISRRAAEAGIAAARRGGSAPTLDGG